MRCHQAVLCAAFYATCRTPRALHHELQDLQQGPSHLGITLIAGMVEHGLHKVA